MTTPPVGHETGTPAPACDLEPDVERLHRAILREPPDPEEGRERAPWWLSSIAILAIFWGGWYLGRYGGSLDAATHVSMGRADAVVPTPSTAAVNPVALGKRVFTINCQACHQATGRGMPGAFPPLVGSEWVVGDPAVTGRILLNGLQGPVTVAAAAFNGAMPAWRDALTDDEIAAVLTYVRQWSPNSAPAVPATLIASIRATTATRGHPWTAPELATLTTNGGRTVTTPAASTPVIPGSLP